MEFCKKFNFNHLEEYHDSIDYLILPEDKTYDLEKNSKVMNAITSHKPIITMKCNDSNSYNFIGIKKSL